MGRKIPDAGAFGNSGIGVTVKKGMERIGKPEDWRRRFAICLGLSLIIHAIAGFLLGIGLRPLPPQRHAEVAPMRIVMLPPQPIPSPPKHRRRHRHHANPLPPSPTPHVARQPVPTEKPQPVQQSHPQPVPVKQVAQRPTPVPIPVKQVAQRPAPPRPQKPNPPSPAPAIPQRTPPAPLKTLTVPAPEAPPAPQTAENPGGSPANGSGSGDHGTGSGIPSGNGNGTGSGAGAGAAPYWPFGIDAGDAGGGGPRHIVYILDISASMTSRIDQARSEIAHAIDTLQPGETFDVLAFCRDTQTYSDTLVPATAANENDAKRFLNRLLLGPGTNLEAALKQALAMPDVNVIVLVTDGVPTVGEQSWKKLERMAQQGNTSNARIYTVGLVGRNPDGSDDSFEATKLLETISRDSGGQSKIYTLGVATPQ